MLACVVALLAGQARADDYTDMLGYLAQTRIEDRVLAGASGVMAVNMAAGDLNQQANLHALAIGDAASVQLSASQKRSQDVYDTPLHASARIGGSALSGASGIASINQASGSGNAEQNAVSLVQAQQSTREAPGSSLSTSAFASAERQRTRNPAGRTASRNVAVEATALRGFEGVLQLNQIAGSANETGNQLLLSISPGP
ncbi:hypothetical protein CSC65_01480 [Pseudoxanthomonas daejeonensis]|uniref:Fap amyloid fibril minor component n=1 Tax=Pseudoxanthomonas daejeonensis TaxID=266062 RepID=A0ABQ6ZC70_9GAMM|nr:hypothetical protein [Pseudoxanthomonas daejeonensis]KAF1697633.1 hypothetical protein CSC65_01480 [Pseudoxanthomonas daejeonensis]